MDKKKHPKQHPKESKYQTEAFENNVYAQTNNQNMKQISKTLFKREKKTF